MARELLSQARTSVVIPCGAGDSACRLQKMEPYQRRLPHIHPTDRCLFITWRLWGSLPAIVSRGPLLHRTPGQNFVANDRLLDRQTTGPLWLKQPEIAEIVSRTILVGALSRRFYDLLAWVVMPNHVHLLIDPLVDVPVLMRWIKGSSAREANKVLGRTGRPFWQDESFDHYLRNSWEVHRTRGYIENNPVAAGLVGRAEEWRWSSAGWQAESPAPLGSVAARVGQAFPPA
jgi:REP element-mobilizing transposase RayT